MPDPADEQRLANERTKHTGEPRREEPADVERPRSSSETVEGRKRDEGHDVERAA